LRGGALLCRVLTLGMGLSSVLACAAETASYPVRPVRFIVPFPSGGGTDIVARLVAQKLFVQWGQQVVVDNRGGAGGTIATEMVARAAPDGYTMLLGTSGGLVINPLLNTQLAYDPLRDLAPVSLLVINPQLLVVNPALPVKSVRELIDLAKARAGKLNYASAGPGSPNHLGMELFKAMTGTDMVHVPYKGAAPGITDLLAGQVQLMFNPMPPLLPHVQSGKLRALGVGSSGRSPAAPDIPTVAEAGVPGFEYVLWYGAFVPAKTPRAIVEKLSQSLVAVLADRDTAQRLTAQGAEPQAGSPAEFARFIGNDTARLKKLIAQVGIKID
jgi:tripartite-type tricarboxylate transporter receptor subunit TctC